MTEKKENKKDGKMGMSIDSIDSFDFDDLSELLESVLLQPVVAISANVSVKAGNSEILFIYNLL